MRLVDIYSVSERRGDSLAIICVGYLLWPTLTDYISLKFLPPSTPAKCVGVSKFDININSQRQHINIVAIATSIHMHTWESNRESNCCGAVYLPCHRPRPYNTGMAIRPNHLDR